VRKKTALPPSKIERTVWADRHRHLYLKIKTTTGFFLLLLLLTLRLLSLLSLMSDDWYIALSFLFFMIARNLDIFLFFQRMRTKKKRSRLVGRERDKRGDKTATNSAQVVLFFFFYFSSSS